MNVRTAIALVLIMVGMAACQSTSTRPVTMLPDDQVQGILEILSGDSTSQQVKVALREIGRGNDQRFVAVLIELIRFGQLGLLDSYLPEDVIITLEKLSGQNWDDNWPAWVEWYGTTDLTHPPGFTTWKGSILSRIDPLYTDFLQDGYTSQIRPEEIQWGGVAVDGIPPLNYPNHVKPEQATYLEPDDVVFGIVVKDDARAYPLRIVDWHEMVNDVIGGIPITLSYCTLCGAAIPYETHASDGHIYTFGTSGLLYRSNKLMYDHQTKTLWNQLTGEPVLGELADTDLHLEYLPIELTTWEDWLSRHPETYVLDINTGYDRPYVPGAAYGDYFSSSDTMFPVWQRSDLLDTKDQIYAIQIDGIAKAYPLKTLTREMVINDTIGNVNIVIVAQEPVSVRRVQDNVSSGYTAGAPVRVYMTDGEMFTHSPDPDTLVDNQGFAWSITDTELIGPGEITYERISGHLAYWFGWYAMFPGTLVYGIDTEGD